MKFTFLKDICIRRERHHFYEARWLQIALGATWAPMFPRCPSNASKMAPRWLSSVSRSLASYSEPRDLIQGIPAKKSEARDLSQGISAKASQPRDLSQEISAKGFQPMVLSQVISAKDLSQWISARKSPPRDPSQGLSLIHI